MFKRGLCIFLYAMKSFHAKLRGGMRKQLAQNEFELRLYSVFSFSIHFAFRGCRSLDVTDGK